MAPSVDFGLTKLKENVRESDNDEAVVVLPKSSQRRTFTDVHFLAAFAVCLIIMIPLSAYFSVGGDINRLIYGYDRHGNVCGIKNKPIAGINCSGQDMTHRPIALLRYDNINNCMLFSRKRILPYKCVDSCNPPSQLIFHRCFPPLNSELTIDSKNYKDMVELFHIFNEFLATIVGMILAGLMLSYAIFICLQWHVAATFWSVTLFQLTIFITSTVYFGHKYIVSEDKSTLYLLTSVGSLIYTVFLLLYIALLHDNLRLVFGIYNEAIRVLLNIRTIFLQPIVILFALTLFISSLIFLILLISSNECLRLLKFFPVTYEYVPNMISFIIGCYLALLILWIFAFAEGYHAMLVSGAVTNYYFAKDKSVLDKPLWRSFSSLIRYHLGTIAFGSFIATLFFFINSIVEFFTRKVYILTAMRGEPFYRSNSRAIKLLRKNVIHAVTLTGFNYIIAYGFTLLVVSLSVGVGLWLNMDNSFSYCVQVALVFGATGAAVTSFFIIKILHTVTETIYFCCCEEQLANEGIRNPAYFNSDLVEMLRIAKRFRKWTPASA